MTKDGLDWIYIAMHVSALVKYIMEAVQAMSIAIHVSPLAVAQRMAFTTILRNRMFVAKSFGIWLECLVSEHLPPLPCICPKKLA
jgi:hypothetical protein